MKRAEQQTEGMQKVAGMIENIGIGMMTWADESGHLSSRPMETLEMDGEGALWYFTQRTVAQAAQGKVNIAFARPDDASYVSVSGRAALLEDRERVHALWSPQMASWFPGGRDDPDLALLRVDVDNAEFWDSSSSTMVRMTSMALAAAKGEPVGLGDTGKVLNPQSPAAVV